MRPTTEAPPQAARRLAAWAIRDGFKPVALHKYTDAAGDVLFFRIRLKHADGRKWIRPMHLNGAGYVLGEPAFPDGKPLYLLPDLAARPDAPIFVVEGESCADALAKLGLLATTSGSADSAETADWAPLAGREVRVWPDNDEAGQRYGLAVTAALEPLGCVVRVLDIDALDLPQKGDCVDWLAANPDAGAADVLALGTVAPEVPERPATAAPEAQSIYDADGKARQQSAVLIDIGRAYALFHDAGGTTYARVPVGSRAATMEIVGTEFRETLSRAYFDLCGKGCNRNSVAEAVATLSSIARYDGAEEPVFLRVAETAAGIEIDIGDASGEAFIVTRDGWTIGMPSVNFRRSGKPLPLPMPATADFARLWHYVNVEIDDRPLVAAWMLAALRPRGPYPICLLIGEQGTGKSLASRTLKRLVDPSSVLLRPPPREDRDLLVAALSSWAVALDNLSGLNPQLSDCLCRISTGGGMASRKLYTDSEEVLIEIQRPMLANGIDDVATRPDLADRCLHLLLPPLTSRMTEASIERGFTQDAPHIFAGLLDALVLAVRDHGAIKLDNPPRMADFATWCAAGLPALGFTSNDFMTAYTRNRDSLAELALEASPVATALVAFMESRTTWTGSTTELLARLAEADPAGAGGQSWPRSGKGLLGALRRMAPALRSVGLAAERDRTSRARTVTVCKVGKQVSQVSQVSQVPPNAAIRPPREPDGVTHAPANVSLDGGKCHPKPRPAAASDTYDTCDASKPTLQNELAKAGRPCTTVEGEL